MFQSRGLGRPLEQSLGPRTQTRRTQHSAQQHPRVPTETKLASARTHPRIGGAGGAGLGGEGENTRHGGQHHLRLPALHSRWPAVRGAHGRCCHLHRERPDLWDSRGDDNHHRDLRTVVWTGDFRRQGWVSRGVSGRRAAARGGDFQLRGADFGGHAWESLRCAQPATRKHCGRENERGYRHLCRRRQAACLRELRPRRRSPQANLRRRSMPSGARGLDNDGVRSLLGAGDRRGARGL
mmetsp:Transcript_7083/g.16557  ORF Transcript_7083/g.16557 Transcript_7083/m.16557 type:complete len:238 (-) Transcript_7083:208-921(-)